MELVKSPLIEKVYIISNISGEEEREFSEADKVNVLRVWMVDNPLSILAVLPIVLRLRPDVVHFNIHFQSFGKSRIANFTGFLLVFLCTLFRLKTVVTLHNLGETVNLKKVGLKPSFANRLGIFIATRLVLSASKIAVTVKLYEMYLKIRYKCGKVIYVPHGTLANMDPQYVNKSCKPEKIILAFGHMGPHKGLSVLLRAFEEIRREKNDIKLVIAGADHPNFPGYLKRLKKNVSSDVIFLGYVSDKDVPKVFETADVVVLPYLTATGTSGVFHLACGYGKPIVVSNLPEIRELIAEGAAALLVPTGDHNALKEALIRVLEDESMAVEMGRRNLIFAQKEGWDKVVEKYEQIYKELLSR
ncbi:MAG: glycosyltransferase [Thermofilaceae archaeon]